MNAADHYIIVGGLASLISSMNGCLLANDNHLPTMSAPLREPRKPFRPNYRMRVWLFSYRNLQG